MQNSIYLQFANSNCKLKTRVYSSWLQRLGLVHIWYIFCDLKIITLPIETAGQLPRQIAFEHIECTSTNEFPILYQN